MLGPERTMRSSINELVPLVFALGGNCLHFLHVMSVVDL